MIEFEDALLIGNQVKAQIVLQRVTIPVVKQGAMHTPGFFQRQTEFQSAGCLVLSQAPDLILAARV